MEYLQRLRRFSRPAKLYLLHTALLTSSLAISGLFFNLALDAMGFTRVFLGVLNTVSIGVAALLSLPLWWLAARIGLRWGLVSAALLNAAAALLFALWPTRSVLLGYSALTGVSAVLFQVSAPPFMMRHSDSATRDHLFTANTAINVGLAGLGSLLAGGLPALFGRMLGVGAESPIAYRATFLITAAGLLLALIPLLCIREQARPAAPPPASAGAASAPGGATLRARLLARLPDFWLRLLAQPGALLAMLIPPLLISFGAALLIPYLNLFFKQRFGIPDQALGAIFALLNVSIGAAALIGPAISMRIGKIRTVALTQAISIPFLIALGFTPLLAVAIGAALVRAALFNMATPLYDAFAMERSEEAARPTVIGLLNGAYSVGYLVAPTISTWVQQQYGFTPLFLATSVCYSLVVLSNYFFFIRGAPATAHPPGQ